MSNQKEHNLIEYLITTLFGAILTGPGGAILSPLIFFFVDRTKEGVIYKSKWAIWIIFGILPFVLTTYPSFILSRKNIYTNQIIRDLNDQALKCRISEFDSARMRSKISTGNALYKTYNPQPQNECNVYKSQPREFKSGFKSIFFWNRNLEVTWFQISINQVTGEIEKICGDSEKIGCEEGKTW